MIIEEGKIYVHTRYEEVPTEVPKSDWEHDGDAWDGFGDGRYICKNEWGELRLWEIDECNNEVEYGDNVSARQIKNCEYLYEEKQND